MARFARRRPYHSITICDTKFYVQFSFIESIKKTECIIYDCCEECVARASVVHKEPDEFSRHRGEQEAFKEALNKYMDKEEKRLQSYSKEIYKRMSYVEKALTYKVFKKTPLELEQSTK